MGTLARTELKINLISINPTKWSNTLKQFLGKSRVNHFSDLALKGLTRKPAYSYDSMVFHIEKVCDMYAVFRKPALMSCLNEYIDPFHLHHL